MGQVRLLRTDQAVKFTCSGNPHSAIMNLHRHSVKLQNHKQCVSCYLFIKGVALLLQFAIHVPEATISLFVSFLK
jgi:hypothetical protein